MLQVEGCTVLQYFVVTPPLPTNQELDFQTKEKKEKEKMMNWVRSAQDLFHFFAIPILGKFA